MKKLFFCLSIILDIIFCQIPIYDISPSITFYPRSTQLIDGSYLTCVGNASIPNKKYLSLYKSFDLKTWTFYNNIISSDNNGSIDLDNCVISQNPNNGRILSSFRYHIGCVKNTYNGVGETCTTNRLMVN